MEKEQILKDILSTALEGGINYWVRHTRTPTVQDHEIISISITPDEDPEKNIWLISRLLKRVLKLSSMILRWRMSII